MIRYSLKRSKRKTLAISVLPDGSVEVTAPQHAPQEVIDHRVQRRRRWIAKQRQFFQQFEPRLMPRRYVRNETHLYLGRQYRLTVKKGRPERVHAEGSRLIVTIPRPANAREIKALLDVWFTERAKARFDARLNALFAPFARRGVSRPKLTVRALRRRWGSTSHAGTLTLNRDLIQAPLVCIDYVLVHELCHLVHADHGPKFFALLSQLMPDWHRRKLRLEKTLASV